MNQWASFLWRYLLTALVGSAVIVLGAPLAHTALTEGRIDDPAAELRRSVGKLTEFWGRPEAPEPPLRPAPARSQPPAAKPAAAKPAAAARPRVPPLSEPSTHPPPEPPSEQPPRWGVVKAEQARTYSIGGKFLGRVPAGSLVEISAVHLNKDRELAVCRILRPPTHRQVLIHVHDLDVRPGELAAVADEERSLRVERARLLGLLEAQRRKAAAARRVDNPYARRYGQARDAYKNFLRRAEDLQERRDKARGAEHMRLADELRGMKNEQPVLDREYREAKARYEEWNKKHPEGPAASTEIARTLSALDDVEERLATMAR